MLENKHAYIGLTNIKFLKLLSIFTNRKHFIYKNLYTRPTSILLLYRLIKWQRKATHTRKKLQEQGIIVPPFMAFSITSRCNLKCDGCYAQAQHRSLEEEMTANQLRQVLVQARELGIATILLLGGEPLVRREILSITQDFPEIFFLLLTNGLFLNESTIKKLKQQRNIVPLISLEGPEQETNQRRGRGVFEHILNAMEIMNKHKIIFGTSATITRKNFDIVVDEQFIKQLITKGCFIIGYIEYLPVVEGTEDLRITVEQRKIKSNLIASFRKNYHGTAFIDLPSDEDAFGGCLFRGGGLIHVSSEGNLEPCVFFPMSDSNLKDMPLIEALQSPLFKTLRKEEEQKNEAKRGCVLWENREWVNSVIRAKTGEEDNLKTGLCSLGKPELMSLKEPELKKIE
ncbi:MAG: radical SAM/SPASM domain-containing protein [Promethearchaeota archaeon]